MTRTLNPMFTAIGVCSLLSSLDKMGITPTLIARQASKVIGPVLADFGKMTLGPGKEMRATNLDEFVAGLRIAAQVGGLADPQAVEASQSNQEITIKWSDCGLKDMVYAGKLFGYSSCPLCLPGVIIVGLLDVFHMAEIREMKVEKSGNTCLIHVSS
ncbi:MAG: hypothetical protein WED05_09015 [Candidatus Atabeyarchaeum deiterrae]